MFERFFLGGLLWAVMMPHVGAEPSVFADPLRPEAPQSVTEPASLPETISLPRLSMIVRNERHHYAVIDGHPLRVGEKRGIYRVVSIRPSSVMLEREGGQRFELFMLSGAIHKKFIPSPVEGNLRP